LTRKNQYTALVEALVKALLRPRTHLAYGQDFIVPGLQGLFDAVLSPNEVTGQYAPVDAFSLVASQNPDNEADSAFLTSVRKHSIVVVHQHCRWEYYSPEQKESVADALEVAKYAIVPAKFLAEDMRRHFQNVNWLIVSNGVRTDRFAPLSAKKRSEQRQIRKVPLTGKLIGYVGRLENAKGFQLLE
jgi:glycosyltransferase involved in cell wall biosynthesis